MIKSLLLKLKDALISVAPVALIVIVLSFTPLLDFTAKELIVFSVSAVLLIIGIALFNLGADLAMTPMGEHTGAGLTKSKKMFILLFVCFIMGVLITIAEPDLSVLAGQVSAVMNGTLLIFTVGAGVGLFLLLAVLKIVFRKNLSQMLMFFYMVLFALCALLMDGKAEFLPLSFDSGGVTTGPITVPFIMSLGVGISTTIGGRNARENSFGLVALCSIGPMLAVVILALFSKGSMSYTLPDFSIEANLGIGMWKTVLETVFDVTKALGLIALFFVILQLAVLKLPKAKIIQIVIGIVYTFIGLVIFLTSVTVGFMPIGFKMGQEIASGGKVLLVIVGLVLGAVVVLAEPAVHVLNKQVEEVTDGGVKKIEMMIALSVGVGLSIALSMIRIIFKFSLLYYIIPGYALSLGLSFFVPKMYTAIAFDSGGVASGPLTSGFILPLALGACSALWGESAILEFAFGIVAMVAMTPLITIQVLGFKAVMSAKVRAKITMKRILAADDEQIIYFDGGE